MHIKEIEIQGFRSYKDQTVIEPFDPRHNIIVGRNGSGKSNLIFAIEFVLSDQYSTIRPEERVKLLHEGTGVAVMSAYVDIKFDNADGRFVTDTRDSDEVSIRRSIGLKKDEFFVNGKHVTKTVLGNLLETAGFSRSNPYYIVKQGRVMALTVMKDVERLELLKEVAGTKVYDERREESLKIMEDTEQKRQQIHEVLDDIQKRLADLEAEKAELQDYQKHDRDRRCLEYTLYTRDLHDAERSLAEIEVARGNLVKRGTDEYNNAVGNQDRVKALESEANKQGKELEHLRKQRTRMDDERKQKIKERNQLDLDARDSEATMAENTARSDSIDADIRKLESDLKKAKKDFERNKPIFEAAEREEKEIQARMDNLTVRAQALYAKQGRSGQFKSKQERDAYLADQVSEMNADHKKQTKLISNLEAEVAKANEQLDGMRVSLEALEDTVATGKQFMEGLPQRMQLAKDQLNQLMNDRKDLWRRDGEFDQQISTAQQDLAQAENVIKTQASKTTWMGIQAVNRIKEEHNIRGVFGILGDLFKCEDKFMTAVDVTAGNSLFNVVVDTDETAARILQILNREKVGRVTFMPLNRLSVETKELPETSDAFPMIKKLEFNQTYLKAMMHVFGKTIICRNMEVSADIARRFDLNAITLDGDRVDRKGAFTGGYIDRRASKLMALQTAKKSRDTLTTLTAQREEIGKRVTEVDQMHTLKMGEIARADVEAETTRRSTERARGDIRNQQQEESKIREALAEKERRLASMQRAVAELVEKVQLLEAEAASNFADKLSTAEQNQLASLNAELNDVKRALVAKGTDRAELEATNNRLKNLIEENLEKRLAALREDKEELALVQVEHSAKNAKNDADHLRAAVDQLNSQLEEMDENIRQNQNKLDKITSEIESLKAEDQRAKENLDGEAAEMDALLSKRTSHQTKKEECMAKLRDLGSLPADAFAKYQQQGKKQLIQLLHKCNETLKKYGHVNKKALDQYIEFSNQRRVLDARMEELDTGAASIKDLIQQLDMKKDEAIDRTFRGVASNFSKVFKELVPKGSASLTMLRRADTQDYEEDEDEPRVKKNSLENYLGVAMKVSFTGGEAYNMTLLSGGQKSLVALALIFAIQRTMAGESASQAPGTSDEEASDPAPFYLFDEIDSALDAAHRTAVANLIHKQSAHAQFITTTFKPELLNHAHKFYLVSYDKRAKVSSVMVCEKDTAVQFVTDTMNEEAAGGGAGAAAAADD